MTLTLAEDNYVVLDHDCLGRRCFRPQWRRHGLHCCRVRSERGCPEPRPAVVERLVRLRRACGWRET